MCRCANVQMCKLKCIVCWDVEVVDCRGMKLLPCNTKAEEQICGFKRLHGSRKCANVQMCKFKCIVCSDVEAVDCRGMKLLPEDQLYKWVTQGCCHVIQKLKNKCANLTFYMTVENVQMKTRVPVFNSCNSCLKIRVIRAWKFVLYKPKSSFHLSYAISCHSFAPVPRYELQSKKFGCILYAGR